MSGFEIAGIVLGALPMLCTVAKDVSERFKNAESWWEFERTFMNFLDSLEEQAIIYEQLLELLVDTLDISDADRESLLQNPNSSSWHEPHIQAGLRNRLQQRYGWFMRNLSLINEATTTLLRLLPSEIHHLDSTSLESELYRLKMSFNNDKDNLLSNIKTINEKLHKFLDRDSRVTKRYASKPKVAFYELHRQAITLYACLAEKGPCSCANPHSIGIAVNPKMITAPKSPGYLNMLLDHEVERKQFKVQIEVLVSEKRKQEDAPAATLNLEAAGELNQQYLLKKQIKLVDKATNEKSVSVLAATSLSIVTHPSSAPARSSLFKPVKKLQKLISPRRGASLAKASSQLSQLNLSSSNSSMSTGNGSTTTNSTITLTSSPDSFDQEQWRVRFESDPPSAPGPVQNTSTINTSEVTDICAFATSGSPTQRLKIDLPAGEDTKVILQFDPSDQGPLQTSKTQTMDFFLSTISPLYPRLQSLQIGLRFALTLLSLATSAWIPKTLDKSSIFLVCGTGTVTKPLGPYFSRSSQHICAHASTAWNARSSLLLLGVVLLELFHGERLEKQTSWAESLVNGQPTESTTICSAFLWMCRTEEVLKGYFGKDLGGGLSAAIYKCIRYDFGRDEDVGDSRLVELVYKEVVLNQELSPFTSQQIQAQHVPSPPLLFTLTPPVELSPAPVVSGTNY
ncbi:hypothetical protein G7Z17_g2496 [Cylindrodendrum hubeiense]|uniref:DUF7580 domain-containing protein n=1 Tax=Cylindrodendrum hubeiense TaxID=595255 RepID=A0A9P5HHH4_9HYPO|nr:hypothetical protein G7Z17_g2496 [Cylindrodendrum hubeiense]